MDKLLELLVDFLKGAQDALERIAVSNERRADAQDKLTNAYIKSLGDAEARMKTLVSSGGTAMVGDPPDTVHSGGVISSEETKKEKAKPNATETSKPKEPQKAQAAKAPAKKAPASKPKVAAKPAAAKPGGTDGGKSVDPRFASPQKQQVKDRVSGFMRLEKTRTGKIKIKNALTRLYSVFQIERASELQDDDCEAFLDLLQVFEKAQRLVGTNGLADTKLPGEIEGKEFEDDVL